jgi:ADP-ribose pyrophosphatase YjhB (NUDIX family)
LEFGENPAAGAAREAAEEVGLFGGSFSFLAITNDIFEEKHFLTIWFSATGPDHWEPRQTSDEVAEKAGVLCFASGFRSAAAAGDIASISSINLSLSEASAFALPEDRC